jgi:hypothetical protein
MEAGSEALLKKTALAFPALDIQIRLVKQK